MGNYDIWIAARDKKSEPDRQNDQGISGFWRSVGAKTKYDEPVAIWPGPAGKQLLKRGGADAPVYEEGSKSWSAFIQWAWPHCVGVTMAEYTAALATGFWADGKPIRQLTAEEKAGVTVEPGGNNPPVDEQIEDQIASAVDSAKKIAKVTNADEARQANEMAERLQTLWRLGDAERDKQKRPHDEAAKAVQAKWLPIITPAETERKRLIAAAKEWIKAEESRLAREAEAERKRKQAEIDATNEAIRKANEEAAGNVPIGADPELQSEIAPAVAETPKVQAASTYGRATGLRTVTRAKITDMKTLIVALSDHGEMKALAEKLANRAALAGIKLDGMEIEKVRE